MTKMSLMEYKRYDDFSYFPIDRVEKASFQRDLNRKHLRAIVKYILANDDDEPILGCIELAHYNSKIYVIDGQHRLRALQRCYKDYGESHPIHTFNYTISSKEEMENIFRLRNKNLNVADYIKKGEVITIRQMADFLMDKWPDIFVTGNCNRPRINIDRFLDKLKESKAASMTFEEFKDYIEKMNIFCKDMVESMNEDQFRRKIGDTMMGKFARFDCYLGYENKWSYLDL